MIKRVVALSILSVLLCTGKIQGDLSESPLSSDSEDYDIGELQVGGVMCVVILLVALRSSNLRFPFHTESKPRSTVLTAIADPDILL